MTRVYNFSAGPAALPETVLHKAAEEMLDWHGSGMSVMEISHRSKPFEAIIQAAEADMRALAGIPDNYKVLFLQGGASLQFSAVPMNLLGAGSVADYVVTGDWSKKALKEAAENAGMMSAESRKRGVRPGSLRSTAITGAKRKNMTVTDPMRKNWSRAAALRIP